MSTTFEGFVFFGHHRGPCYGRLLGPAWLAIDIETALLYAKGGWVDVMWLKTTSLVQIDLESVKTIVRIMAAHERPGELLPTVIAHRYTLPNKCVMLQEMNRRLPLADQFQMESLHHHPSFPYPAISFDTLLAQHLTALYQKKKLAYADRVTYESLEEQSSMFTIAGAWSYGFLHGSDPLKFDQAYLRRKSITSHDRFAVNGSEHILGNGYLAYEMYRNGRVTFHAEIMLYPHAFAALQPLTTESSATILPYLDSVKGKILLDRKFQTLLDNTKHLPFSSSSSSSSSSFSSSSSSSSVGSPVH